MSQPWAQNPGSWCQAWAGAACALTPHHAGSSVPGSDSRRRGCRQCLPPVFRPRWGGVGREGACSLFAPCEVSLLGLLSPPHPWFSKDHPQLQRSPCSGGKYAVTHRLRGTWLYLRKARLMQQDWLLFTLGAPHAQ